jgi:hypothetical protein
VPYLWFFILFLICHLIVVSLHAHVFMKALKVSMTVFFSLLRQTSSYF